MANGALRIRAPSPFVGRNETGWVEPTHKPATTITTMSAIFKMVEPF
jgi:hypothetical protein